MQIQEQLLALQAMVSEQEQQIKYLEEAIASLQRAILLPKEVNYKEHEFYNLKILLETDYWPEAVDLSLVCKQDSEADKLDRAQGILDCIVDQSLENSNFLDFGCGEGHVVEIALKHAAKKAIGYDVKTYPGWLEKKSKFTNKWNEVKQEAPFNVILIYDVLDHIEGEENLVISILKDIKSVLSPGGKIYVRCHPWTSRHATHLYHTINKAYLHVIFSNQELELLNIKNGFPVRQYIHPVTNYNNLFEKANLKILKSPRMQTEPIEPFFTETPLIVSRIKNHYRKSPDKHLKTGDKFPALLQLQFVDYILG